MVLQHGIHVLLKDSNGNIIKTTAGRIVAAPGDKYQVCITVLAEFRWYDATRLYVEIASRDATTRKALWDGEETQVLCIRKGAPPDAHNISEMKLWDMFLMKPEPTIKPFIMPSPFYPAKNNSLPDDKVPHLQARRGCIQVSFRRGHIRSKLGTFKRRLADPRTSLEEVAKSDEPCQYIVPKWFESIEGIRGEPIVFEFRNTSGETVVIAKKEPVTPKMMAQHVVPTAVMQAESTVKPASPAVRKIVPRQHSVGSRQMPGGYSSDLKETPQKDTPQKNTQQKNTQQKNTRQKMTPQRDTPQKSKQQPATHQPVCEVSSDDEDYEEIFELAPTSLSIPKRSDPEHVSNRKIKVVLTTPRRVSSKRGREPRTPSPQPNGSSRLPKGLATPSSALATPSSAQSRTPMSSQKKRKVQLIEMELRELRLQRELLALNDDEE